MYKQSLRLRLKFWGKVRIHNQRGRKLGFPTANINVSRKIAEGIYVSKTKIGEKGYKSLTFIGTAKTFGEIKFHAENYILDFKGDLYGLWISIELLKKLRGNKKFKSADDLIKQMKDDEKMAREFFKTASFD